MKTPSKDQGAKPSREIECEHDNLTWKTMADRKIIWLCPDCKKTNITDTLLGNLDQEQDKQEIQEKCTCCGASGNQGGGGAGGGGCIHHCPIHNPQQDKQEWWIKEFEKMKLTKCPLKGGCQDCQKTKQFISNLLTQERERTAIDICKLLDDIELKQEFTGGSTLEEWKQWKHIRNAIRDKFVKGTP